MGESLAPKGNARASFISVHAYNASSHVALRNERPQP